MLYDYNAHKPMGNNRGSAFVAGFTFKLLVYTRCKMCCLVWRKTRLRVKSDAWHRVKLLGEVSPSLVDAAASYLRFSIGVVLYTSSLNLKTALSER